MSYNVRLRAMLDLDGERVLTYAQQYPGEFKAKRKAVVRLEAGERGRVVNLSADRVPGSSGATQSLLVLVTSRPGVKYRVAKIRDDVSRGVIAHEPGMVDDGYLVTMTEAATHAPTAAPWFVPREWVRQPSDAQHVLPTFDTDEDGEEGLAVPLGSRLTPHALLTGVQGVDLKYRAWSTFVWGLEDRINLGEAHDDEAHFGFWARVEAGGSANWQAIIRVGSYPFQSNIPEDYYLPGGVGYGTKGLDDDAVTVTDSLVPDFNYDFTAQLASPATGHTKWRYVTIPKSLFSAQGSDSEFAVWNKVTRLQLEIQGATDNEPVAMRVGPIYFGKPPYQRLDSLAVVSRALGTSQAARLVLDGPADGPATVTVLGLLDPG